MRAYTAWVIATGKGDNMRYAIDIVVSHPEGEIDFLVGADIRRALQFARRADARKVLDGTGLVDFRPVEKTFG